MLGRRFAGVVVGTPYLEAAPAFLISGSPNYLFKRKC
jgi:hypothetical protein